MYTITRDHKQTMKQYNADVRCLDAQISQHNNHLFVHVLIFFH